MNLMIKYLYNLFKQKYEYDKFIKIKFIQIEKIEYKNFKDIING